MTRLQEVEQLLNDLSPEELSLVAASALRRRGDDHPGITSSPDISGGDPCIVRTRIPVWMLETYRRRGASNAEILNAYPSLLLQDLLNAWSYVEANRAEIERQIAEQEAA